MRLNLTSSTLAIAAFWSMPAAAQNAEMFNRIATFPVAANLPTERDPAGATVSEIVAATEDGMMLVYTDSQQKAVGLIDIADPEAPKPAGFVALEGEPTSVAIAGGKAFLGVVTSESFTEPAGQIAVVDLQAKTVDATCDVPGQPDAIALNADGSKVVVVLENQRDEELNDGRLPQAPSGALAVFSVADGAVDCASLTEIALTGLAEVAAEDAEPEFVDINATGEAVVTLQENNHIAIVDLESGKVTAHFPAGAVDLDGVDTEEDGVIRPVASLEGVKREPDAVQWIDGDRFVTANEGDYEGGSRGFSIFDRTGEVLYDSATALDDLAMRIGHYPEARSDAKGTEPEGMEVAQFGGDLLIFVGTERSSFVAVYRDTGAEPELLQLLPTGVGPEGLLAIPERGLFVVASEEDLVAEGGARSTVMLYERSAEPADYPTLIAADMESEAIGWGALSGLTADPREAGRLYAVTDSVYSEAQILEIDATITPGEIVRSVTVSENGAPMQGLDLEGIAVREDGSFWLASEGNPEEGMQNRLIRVSGEGSVQEIIAVPDEIAAQATGWGLEGVTVIGGRDSETVWLAVQREWGDDAEGMVKLLSYEPASQTWGVVHYPLDDAEQGWIGLSEITAVGDDRLVVVERDNQIGGNAEVKRLYAVSISGIAPAEAGAEIPLVEKVLVRDLMDDLRSPNGYVFDKVEGFAIDNDGSAFMVTDNDGVDGSSGETQFMILEDFRLPN